MIRGYDAHRALLILSIVLFGMGAEASAQTRIAVLEEPGGTAVGIALSLNAGGAWELASEAGIGHLAALAVVEEARPAIEALGGWIGAECDVATITFTLVAAPTRWEPSLAILLETIFDRMVSQAAVDEARRRLAAAVGFTIAGEADEARTALARARFGADHRWARRPCGRPETLTRLDVEDVRRLIRSRFIPSRATVAVAGPVEDEQVRRVLAGVIPETRLPILVPGPGPTSATGLLRIERETVTSWASIAFPFEDSAAEESLRLLAFHLRETAMPPAGRPDVYDVQTLLERHGEGGALIVHLVTTPSEAAPWIRRLEEAVRATAATAMPDETFRRLVRRYRAERLTTLSAPEARARNASRQLLLERRYDDVAASIDALTADTLRAAAKSLGTPAAAILGPR